MAALSVLQNKSKNEQAQKQAKIDAAEGQPGASQAQGGGASSGLASLLGSLQGSKKDPGKAPDLTTAFQSNGASSDPLSYNSVKDLNGIGVTGQAPSTEDDLSLLGS